MNSLIKQYIDKLKYDDIDSFFKSNDINLSSNEISYLLEFTKKYYEDILSGNDDKAKIDLKKNLPDNYNKIIKLYDEYKVKYSSFLN